MRAIRIEAHAKVNLGLAVLGIRPDGYHDIDTVFQTISLADSLTIEARPDRRILLAATGQPVPGGPENLAWQAASAVMTRTDCFGVTVSLEKRIPVGAGLGGGSADAAAVLVGMDALFGLSLTPGQLAELALGIGSDVPFLLEGGTARGKGRGEELDHLKPFLKGWFVLVTPPFQVSAGEAYERVRIGLTDDGAFIRLILSGIQQEDLDVVAGAIHNDLEAGVVAVCPQIDGIKTALKKCGATGVAMCGSGPTVLGIAGRKEEADGIASRISGHGLSARVARPVDSGCRVLDLSE